MEVKIYPSVMCFDWMNLGATLRQVEEAGADGVHFDIMDGSFVPNFTMGPDMVRAVRRHTDLPIDCHLMCWRPELHIDAFRRAGADVVSVHAEATVHLQRTLAAIRSLGASPAVALNPHTPLEVLKYVLDDIDMVMLMMVNPGFAGQKLIPSTLNKVAECAAMTAVTGREVEIQVDGNVSFEHAPRMVEAGASILVAGTSSVFSSEHTPSEGMRMLREACRQVHEDR